MEEIRQPNDDWSRFAVAIFRLNGLIMAAGENIARPVGQSSARWQVLGRASQPQTVAAMAADMGNARQSVQRLADALERDGLVSYLPHPSDRRTKLVQLTPKGLEVLTAIYRRQLAWSERITTALDAAELTQATEALDTIGALVEASITTDVPTAGSPLDRHPRED